MKRTLTRCHKFEDSGSSCFSELALQDVIFSTSSHKVDAKTVDFGGSTTATNTFYESAHQMDDRGFGMVNVTVNPYQINLKTQLNSFFVLLLAPLQVLFLVHMRDTTHTVIRWIKVLQMLKPLILGSKALFVDP